MILKIAANIIMEKYHRCNLRLQVGVKFQISSEQIKVIQVIVKYLSNI